MSTRRFRRLGMMVAFGAMMSCGGAPAAPPATTPPATAAAPVVTVAAQPGSDGTAVLPAVDSLLDLVPRDAVLVANFPRTEWLDPLIAGVAPDVRDAMLTQLVTGLSPELKPELASSLVEAFDGATVFLDGDAALKDFKEQIRNACVAMRFRDPGPIQQLLAARRVRHTAEGRFVLEGDKRNPAAHGAWLASSRTVLFCADPAPLSRSLRVAGGREGSFKTSGLIKAEGVKQAWVAIDLHRFSNRDAGFEPGSRLFAAVPFDPGSPGFDVELAAYGPTYPRLGTMLAARNQATMAKLPAGAVSALGLSLQRSPGKTLRDLLSLFDGLSDVRAESAAGAVLGELGLELRDLEKALGDEAAVGFYLDPKHKPSADTIRADIEKHGAILVAVATGDGSAQKQVFSALSARAKRKAKKLTVGATAITADLGDGREFRIESRAGLMLFGVGEKKYLGQISSRFGKEKESLGTSAAFSEARSHAGATQHLLGYLDLPMLKAVLGSAAAPAQGPTGLAPFMLSIMLKPSDRGLDLAVNGNAGIELVGMAAGLGVYGVRRYWANAKTAEARNTVGAIARAAAAAFERELAPSQLSGPNAQPLHQLCKSARPVPSAVPKGMRYAPSSRQGQDFDQGDDASGWHCLRFEMTQPIYYQYDYRAGGGYKGPARGGPDPGKDGLEVSAEGDINGDGKTSLFTRTGKIVKGELILDPQLFISEELE